MKYSLLIITVLISKFCFCQTKTVHWRNKSYVVYTGFPAANKVPVDSVQGLSLMSNNFKDFPKEVLRYKNLKYLEIGTYYYSEVLDSLDKNQLKKYEYYKKKYSVRGMYTMMGKYKTNKIKNIPKEIQKLNKLEVVDFMTARIYSKKKFRKIYSYLPNTEILPDKDFLEQNYR